MGRPAKILAWLIAAFVAVFALAAIVFFLFFDPNDFRDEIANAVTERTGRELRIDGDVSLALFPWLAIEVGHTTLGNAPGFGDKPFAEFERAKMSVRLLPLLFRQEITVGAVAVESLILNLQENSRGVSNWEDLASGDEPAADEAGSPGDADADVDVAGIEFTSATVRYLDSGTNSEYVLGDADLRIGPISGDRENLFVNGFSIDGALEGVASMPTRLRITTKGIAVQTLDKTVTMQPVEMTVLGIDIEADVDPFSYAGSVEPGAVIRIDAFSPRSLMHLLDIEAPKTADPVALSRVIVDAKAAFQSNSVELTDVTIKLDDTTFKGELSVPRSSGGGYRFDLDADRIDLNRYMEPAGEAAQGGTGESVAVEIPSDLIKPLNARGNLRVTSAALGGMEFENVVLGLNTANGRMRIHPVTAALYGGSYSGDVRIDAAGATPVISVDEKIQDVNLADLARAMFKQDNITGTISGGFNLTGRGNDLVAVQRSLAGNMTFQLVDGAYEGTDIWYELRRARALIKGGEAPKPELPARTKFSSVSATGSVTDGVMRNDDLVAELPFMQMSGRGTVDLAAATVNYDLTARVLERPESLQNVTEAELKDFTKAVIPLKITGPLSSPSVKPDVEKLLRKRVEDEIKGRLLGDLLGGKKQTPPAEGEPVAEPPAEGEPKEAPAEESVEDQLKDKLKDLLGG